MRRVLLALAVLAGGATAAAQPGSPAQVPEPELEASDVIRLPSAAVCRTGGRVRIRLFSPRVTLDEVAVRVDALTVVRLTDLQGSAAVVANVPVSGARVRVEAVTEEGQSLLDSARYRSCRSGAPAPRPRPSPQPVQVGGGED